MKHKIIGLLLLAGLIVPACIDDTNPLETHPVQPTAGSDAELDIEESDAGSDDGGCKPNCVGKQCGP